MLDDSTLDRLLAEADPDPQMPEGTDVAWARLLASSPRRSRRRVLTLAPAISLGAAVVAFALVNWLPTGSPASVSAAFAQTAITRTAALLTGKPGQVLYTDVFITSTFGRGQHASSEFQSWQQLGPPYDNRSFEPGRNTVSEVVGGSISLVDHRQQWLDPSNHTIYLEGPNHQVPPPDAAAQAAASALGVSLKPGFASLAELLTTSPRVHVAREGQTLLLSLTPTKITNRKPAWRFYVDAETYRPLRIVARYPLMTMIERYAAYRFLPSSVGLAKINLPTAYPNLRVIRGRP